ncbi:hypothetical protein MVEN_00702900 [Mycena venus]|uniref:Protein kinase domain-containing protein n=1 Tax=Mycena venus TaxID=2733690 RepID=A0A8H6YKV0_9AGAR|nr:hypothetical protein MVEN_00702900 [Mycena venus]
MDAETHTTTVESTAQLDLGIVGHTCNAAFINHSAHDINVRDCTTNVTFTTAPSLPEGRFKDFRRIPLGDIDLLHEIRVNYDSGIVDLQHKQTCFRRVYSARINGRKSKVTVAMYQGNGAEERWQHNIAKYRSIRHPNIVQIWGTATSGNMHATIFHDDLIPLEQILDLYGSLPILTVYIYACSNVDFKEAINYFQSGFRELISSYSCTFWIRRSTCRLCAELIPPWNSIYLGYRLDRDPVSHRIEGNYLLSASLTDAMVIDTLTLQAYHDTCAYNLSHFKNVSVSTHIPVRLGSLVCCSSSNQPEGWIVISSVPLSLCIGHWRSSNDTRGDEMGNGWTRFCSSDAFNTRFSTFVYPKITPDGVCECWLAQANHIFSRLGIMSNLEDFVLITAVRFTLKITLTIEDPPTGFLFLCPKDNFRTGPSSFQWPDCSAYWSLDPSGTDRLSTEEAEWLGFPTFQLNTEIWRASWDDSVYAGLRQFHQAKGFDPDSQDVARHLGYLLLRLSSEIDPPFDHVLEALNEGDLNTLFTEDELGYLETSANEPAEDKDSLVKEDDQDSSISNDESEDIKSSVGNNHEFSARELIASGELPDVEPPVPQDDMPVPRATKLLMNIQMALFLILALFWLYEQA